ncbi:restriction endonuclease subunit S [Vibrio artabrorum]|uniref:restriction endonuclease subunit S n=1 Tax=Vibrio artabrorum TaxID=446374 RepID=UPI003553FFA0
MSQLPKGWELITLKEECKSVKGKKPKSLEIEQRDSLVPYVDIKAFEKGIFTKFAEANSGVLAQENDTLMVWDGARSGLVGNGVKGVIGSTLAKITPNYSHRRYLHYFLKSKFDHINTKTKGTGIPHVDPAVLWSISYPLAPLNEQIRIANKLDSILTKVDKAQARLDKIPAILKRFRQSVLAAATSGELTKEWRENSVLVDITEDYIAPESWKMSTISELSMLVTSGSRGWAKYYSQEGSLFVRAQNINSDKLNLEDIAYVALPEKIEGRRTNIEKDDLLITITGANVTKAAKVHTELEDAYVSQHVCLVKLREKSSANFIELFLHDKSSGRGQLAEVAYGGGKPGLNLANIRDLKIALPPIEEQTEIVRQVDRLLNKATKVEKQYLDAKARLDRLTQSILAKAFQGELVPQDPNDEPAEQLLERILKEREQAKPKKTTRKRTTKAKTVEKG